ncbi:MAG TPA: ferritin-like domain-containing protein [Polyangiaceae bacterium]|jgi:rubrerythrin|nr:ferritin-like domain-containing protein [Polyangiaceae bacterium]
MQSSGHSQREDDETMKAGSPAEEELDIRDLDSESEGELEEEDVADDESDDSDLNLLIALAELDAEAAEAYRIAAEYTDQVHFRTKLEEFRADHIRHVETFNRLLSEAGAPEVSIELDEESSALTMLAASMGTMGVRAALLAMIASEQLTNATYQATTELPFEEDVARILEEHLTDEQRHLEWLNEQESRVRDDELLAEADA